MKTLPSEMFPGCTFSPESYAGFYNITPTGFDHIVSLYLGGET
jgi:hypothetical protein